MMTHPLTSRKKAQTISLSLFLVALAIVSFTGKWWPGMMLVVGIPLAIKQYLLGKRYDVLITLLVFIGGFISVSEEFSWPVLLPVLFTLGAIYVFCRDMIEASSLTEEEQEEDLNEEIEETQHDK
jgi:hypothetical protein